MEYLDDDWTSFSDIGKIFNGSVLTYSQYIVVENLYIDVIKTFMKSANIEQLSISDLEMKTISQVDEILPLSTIDIKKLYNQLENGISLKGSELDIVIRLILREFIWAKLKSTANLEIHFGYDYYMYIGCLQLPKNIQNFKLVVESYKSPYIS